MVFCQPSDVEFSWSFMRVMRQWTKWEKDEGKEMEDKVGRE